MTSPGGAEVGRISIRVVPDTSRFRRELKTQLEKLERSIKATVPVDVELDTAGAVANMRTLMTRLRAQAADGINIDADVIGGRLNKQLSQLGDSAGYAGQQFLGLTRTGWLVAAVTAAMAPAVGLVSGLLAGLPSLISAFGAGAGAVALGLDGIKAAAASLTPQPDALKASVSGVFEQRLTPIFDQLKGLFPAVEAGMGQVTNGLADMFQGFTNVVTSGQGLSQIQSILAQTGSLFSQLGPTIGTFTQSFLTLAHSGANAFGHLLGPLQTFGTQFNEMVTRITSNGAFDGAMQGLSQTLGSVLNLFTRLMETGVTAMGQLGGPLTTLINGIGDTLVAAMPALTSFSALIGNVLGTALSTLAPQIQAITPAFTALANVLGAELMTIMQSLAPVLTQVAGALGTALTTALQTLQPLLPGLLSTFQQFATVLSGSLAQHLPAMAQAFGQLLGSIQTLAPSIMQLVTEGLIPMVPALVQLGTAGAPAVAAFAQLATAITPLLTLGARLVAMFTESAAAMAGPFVAAATAVVGAISTVITKVSEWVSSVVSGVGQVTSEMSALPGKITTALGNMGSLLVDSGKALIQGLINGITSMIGSAISTVKNVGSSIVGAFKGVLGINSPSKVFHQIGLDVNHGLKNGLDAGFKSVLDRAKDMGSELGKAIVGPGNEFDKQMETGLDLTRFLDPAKGFADAASQSLMSDLGMSGQGAIPQLIQQGAGFLGDTINLHVSNIDDAIAAKNNWTNKKALQHVQR